MLFHSASANHFVTPWHIREMCIHSLENGDTGYTSNYGLLELREEISKRYKRDYRLDYDPQKEILVTTGVSEALDISIRSITNPGDEIIVVQPTYVAYIPEIILSGGTPVIVKTCVENEFKVTPEELESKITPKTKAVVLNYPHNPTGAVMTRADYEKIAPIIEKHDLIVISDEVLNVMTYDGATHSVFRHRRRGENHSLKRFFKIICDDRTSPRLHFSAVRIDFGHDDDSSILYAQRTDYRTNRRH